MILELIEQTLQNHSRVLNGIDENLKMYRKKIFLVNFIVSSVVTFDLSLISSIVVFTFTSSVSKDFNIKLISVISYIPGGNVHPLIDPAKFLTSNISTIQSKVNSFLLTITSRSLKFTFFNFASISLLKLSKAAKLDALSSSSFRMPLFSNTLTCKSISF